MEKPANQQTIKPATNLDLSILHLDFLYDENIVSLLEVIVKDAYNTDKDVILTGKKRTGEKVALLSDNDIVPAGIKKTQRKRKMRLRKKKKMYKKNSFCG